MKENKDEDYLPWIVSVEKSCGGDKFKVIPRDGILSDIEKELFEFGMERVVLKNNFGNDIEYYKMKNEKAGIVDGVAKGFYSYESNRRMHDEELRRK
jgi:hypothetical protein